MLAILLLADLFTRQALTPPRTAADPLSALGQIARERATRYIEVLHSELGTLWPDFQAPDVLAGQIEQETCITLEHRKCWNPAAELNTDREYGFGLGQLTKTSTFDAFAEAKKYDSLKNWYWDDRFNPLYQLRILVLTDRNNYQTFPWAATEDDREAFMLSAYNGGKGSVLKDRVTCRFTSGCDPSRWFRNIELTSAKSKMAIKAYGGASLFQINRNYVKRILTERRTKYTEFEQLRGARRSSSTVRPTT